MPMTSQARPAATPLISVVVPTADIEVARRWALPSLLGQTAFSDFEVVLVLDNHADPEPADLAVLDHVTVLRSAGHLSGPGAARNRGIAAASGRYITFLDDDDSYHPERLSVLSRHLAGRDVIADVPLVTDGEVRYRPFADPPYLQTIPIQRYLHRHTPICLVHRNTKQVTFREDVTFAEDTLYKLQVIDAFGGGYLQVGFRGYEYRVGPGRLTDSGFQHIDGNYRTILDAVIPELALGSLSAEQLHQAFLDKRGFNREYYAGRHPEWRLGFQDYARRCLKND